MSLIREDKDIPATAAVPAAPLFPRRARSVVPGSRSPPVTPQVLPVAAMTEGAQAADEVRVPLGAPAAGPAVAAGASPASPGAPGREAERGSGAGASPPESPEAGRSAELGADEEPPVPYPALAATVFFCLGQTTRPRSWCLRLVCNPYPSRAAGPRGRGAWGPEREAGRVGAGAGRARGPRRARSRGKRGVSPFPGGVSPVRSPFGMGEGGGEAARPSRTWEGGGRQGGKAGLPWVAAGRGPQGVRQRQDPRRGRGGLKDVE